MPLEDASGIDAVARVQVKMELVDKMRVWKRHDLPASVAARYSRTVDLTLVGASELLLSEGGEVPKVARPMDTLVVLGGMGENGQVAERFVPALALHGVLIASFDYTVCAGGLVCCALLPARCLPGAAGPSHRLAALLLLAAARRRPALPARAQHPGLHRGGGAGGSAALPAQQRGLRQDRSRRLLHGRPGCRGGGFAQGAGGLGHSERPAAGHHHHNRPTTMPLHAPARLLPASMQ